MITVCFVLEKQRGDSSSRLTLLKRAREALQGQTSDDILTIKHGLALKSNRCLDQRQFRELWTKIQSIVLRVKQLEK